MSTYERIEKYTVNEIPNVGYEVLGYWKDDVHDLHTRMVFDYYTYKIIEADSVGSGIPFDICQEGLNSIKLLIGEQVGPGFHKVVNSKLVNTKGCMHMAEMVLNSVKAGLQGASREVPEWACQDDYSNRWAGWEIMYKDKCIYYGQKDVLMNNPESIQDNLKQRQIK